MVEIAIALAVIAFALVAIIGILPAGLNVQRENREETIINQDAAIWMNALRGGSRGTDYLTNYVDAIQIETTAYNADGTPAQANPDVYRYTAFSTYPIQHGFSGFTIVGLLSTPKYVPLDGGGFLSNHVTAYVRAISGNVSEKSPNDNPSVREGAFAYRLNPEIVPFFSQGTRWTNYADFRFFTANPANTAFARNLAHNHHEFRLNFRWPLRPPFDPVFQQIHAANPVIATNVGSGRQVFRTTAAGVLQPDRDDPDFFFFRHGVFRREGTQ